MNKLKKSMSVLLTLVMLFTTLCFFVIPEAKVEADAAVANTNGKVAFYVPEVIYLYPNATAWRDATSTPFQFYVENTVNTASIYSAPTTNTELKSNGTIYFAAEHGFSDVVISSRFMDKNGNTISGGSVTVGGFSSKNTYGTFAITAGTSPSLAAATTGCYIEWTLTYTNGNSERQSVIAYTYVYKPYTVPYGGVVWCINTKGTDNYARQLSWVTGVHQVASCTTAYDGAAYPRFGTNGTVSMASFLSSQPTGYIGSTQVTGTLSQVTLSHLAVSETVAGAKDMYAVFATENTATSYFYAMQSGSTWSNKDCWDWVTTDTGVTDRYDKASFNHWYREHGETNEISYMHSSALGTMYIDTSRYSDLSEIPNLGVGLMVTADNSSSVGSWFVADATDKVYTTGSYTGSGNRNTFFIARNYTMARAGGEADGDMKNGDGYEVEQRKYTGTWVRPIDKTVLNKTYTVSGYYGNHRDGNHALTYVLSDLKAIQYNKASLRAAVNNALSKFAYLGVKDNFGSYYYDTTSTAWTNFVNAYKAAAQALVLLDGEVENIETIVTTLNNAIAALEAGQGRIIKFDVNYGDINVNNYILGSVTDGGYGLTVTYNSDESITLNGTITGSNELGKTVFSPKVGTYTFSAKLISGTKTGDGCVVLDSGTETGANISTRTNFDFSGSTWSKKSYTNDTAKETDFLRFWVWKNADNTKYDNFRFYIKIEEGSAETAYSPAARIATASGTYPTLPTPTRTGYIFDGWYTDSSLSTQVSAGSAVSSDTLYAKWEANKYDVVFDNLIDFKQWNTTTASNATFSNVTENGFTLTCNAGAGEGTSTSPFFPVTPGKQYKIDIDFEGDGWDVYIFFCDANGNWIDFADGPSNRYSSSGATGIYPDNAVFTAPNKAEVVKAQIRVDANGANNTVRFENIRVTENGYVDNAVSFCPTKTFTYDGTYSALPTPTRENYRFLGWYTAPNGGGTRINSSDTVKITEKTHLYSHWTDESYNIVFDANGGTGTMDKAVAPIGVNYTLPANTFTRTGYRFLGWSTDKNATSATYSDKAAVNLSDKVATITLYAIWSANSYTLTFNSDGGSAVGSITGKYGAEYNKPANPTKTGYTFKGWSPALPDTIPAQSVTYTAIWEPNEYTVSFDSNGGEGSMPDMKASYNQASNLAANAFTKTGFTFKGWATIPGGAVIYTDGAEIENLTSQAGGSVTLYAVWSENSYTVVYDRNGGSGTVASQTFKYTDAVTLRDNSFTKTGYHFVGWAETADGAVKYAGGQTLSGALTAENGKTITLYAVWEKNTYTVTFNKNDAAATGEMAKQTLTYDVTATLSGLGFTKEGYSFVGWNTQSDGKGTSYADKADVLNLTAANNGNVTLYAIWAINTYDVTFNYTTATGEEKAVEINDIPHGKAFDELVSSLEGFSAFYYDGTDASPDTNKKHYKFTEWANAVEAITADVTFTAVYDTDGEAHSFIKDTEKSVEETCTADGKDVFVCEDCKFTYEVTVNEINGHNWIDGENTATCTEGGKIARSCSRCHITGEMNSAPLGHSFEAIEYTAPDCVNTGFNEHLHCTRCMLYFEVGADSLSKDGKATNADFIIPAGHTYVGPVAATSPSCTSTGTITHYTCEKCDVLFDENKTPVETIIIPATGHDYSGEWVETTAPDCENAGEETLYCKNSCGEALDTREVEPTGHAYEATVTQPTCTEKGYTTHICKNDNNHKYVDSYVDATGHSYGDFVADSGKHTHTKTCTVCHGALTGGAVTEDCTAGEAVKENEVFATCSTNGKYDSVTYCTVCDQELSRTEIPVTATGEHVYVNEIERVASTCKVEGYVIFACGCGAQEKQTLPVDKVNGHKAADSFTVIEKADCENDGYKAKLCVYCDEEECEIEVIKKREHSLKDTTIKIPATCTTKGVMNQECINAENAEYKACEHEATRETELDPDNHSTTERVVKDDKAATCCEEGFTGNEYCKACDKIVSTGTAIPTTKDNHAGGTRTEKENTVPGTCMAEETWNDVTYCIGCGDKLNTVAREGIKNPQNHTGHNTIYITNEKPATCATPNTWTELTVCECSVTVRTENKTGSKNPEVHTGETYTDDINEKAGDCMHEATWTEVTYCKGCDKELGREGKTGEKDPLIHTGVTEVKEENIVPGTCIAERTWNDVTYCECGVKLNTEAKVGSKDADNHTGTPTEIEGYKEPTCKEQGYTGDKHYTCCGAFAESGTAIPTTDHKPGEAVIENNVPPTDTADGQYDSVTYCTFCGKELSRVTVQVRPEREITFVFNGESIVIKAQLGDTITAPEVPDYTAANGFIHKFKSWDKPVTAVTGKTTYTAVYTQPCDYSQVDALEKTLNEVIDGNYVSPDVLEKNKAQLQSVLKEIEDLKNTRNTLDKDYQYKVDAVAISIIEIIDIIYPDAGSTLVIQGSSMAYLGTVLDLKAIKMPLGAVLTDAVWVSSDDNVVCFANGKLYAVGIGTVTVTATRGMLKASKVITIIEGGNIRGVNFTSVNSASFVIEGFKTVKDSAVVYWSNDLDLRFAINVSQSYLFDDFIVYINGVEVTPDASGYYVIPAGSGDARVTIAATVEDDDGNGGQTVTKWSFWEWLLSFFRKIADFFKGLFR